MRSDCRWLALSSHRSQLSIQPSHRTVRLWEEEQSRSLSFSFFTEFTASLTELWPFWSFGSSFYNISSRRKQAEFKLWRRAQRRSGDEPPVCPLWQDRVPDGESQLPGQGGNFSLGTNQTLNKMMKTVWHTDMRVNWRWVTWTVKWGKLTFQTLFKLHACKNTGSLYITTLRVQR